MDVIKSDRLRQVAYAAYDSHTDRKIAWTAAMDAMIGEINRCGNFPILVDTLEQSKKTIFTTRDQIETAILVIGKDLTNK